MMAQVIILGILSGWIMRSILMLVMSMDMYSGKTHRKRLKQLDFNNSNTETDMEKIEGLVGKITKPIIDHLLPNYKIKDIDKLEADLRMAQWDKVLSPIQFIALSILGKIIGLIYFIYRYKNGTFFGVVIGGSLMFGINFFMKNSIKERTETLLIEFPDFIRMMDVYLSSGMTYIDALMHTIGFMGEEWQEILELMIIEASKGDIESSLDILPKEFNIVDAKEFTSLVKLSFRQGGELSSAFRSQADKASELYVDAKELQIERRAAYATLVQLPIMIALFLAFGLPMAGQIMSFMGG